MSYYQDEPPFQHGDQLKVGILLANLGTPDAPTATALKRYLGQFLMDRRIVEIPRAIWCWILHLIILNIRPKKSAEKYASVWMTEGSPLMVHAQAQKNLLEASLRKQIASSFAVELGMSYGNPSIASALAKLKAQHCDRILLFPLYPQYAASSTAASLDALWRALLRTRNVPAIRTIRHYHDHPAYIRALAESVRAHWAEHGKPSKLIMSFHGVPKFHLMKGDPYHCQCMKTGRLLAQALGLDNSEYLVAFQSRFGKQEWLKPYLAETLENLAKQNTARVDVICPGFSSDCLETLEEIAMEGKQIFLSNGGGEYHYIPALNAQSLWIQAMTEIAIENLHGWASAEWDAEAAIQENALRDQRAKALSAQQQ